MDLRLGLNIRHAPLEKGIPTPPNLVQRMLSLNFAVYTLLVSIILYLSARRLRLPSYALAMVDPLHITADEVNCLIYAYFRDSGV